MGLRPPPCRAPVLPAAHTQPPQPPPPAPPPSPPAPPHAFRVRPPRAARGARPCRAAVHAGGPARPGGSLRPPGDRAGPAQPQARHTWVNWRRDRAPYVDVDLSLAGKVPALFAAEPLARRVEVAEVRRVADGLRTPREGGRRVRDQGGGALGQECVRPSDGRRHPVLLVALPPPLPAAVVVQLAEASYEPVQRRGARSSPEEGHVQPLQELGIAPPPVVDAFAATVDYNAALEALVDDGIRLAVVERLDGAAEPAAELVKGGLRVQHAGQVSSHQRARKVPRRRQVEVGATLGPVAAGNLQYPARVQAVPCNGGARVVRDSVGVVASPLEGRGGLRRALHAQRGRGKGGQP